jgi:hypothetical protein
MEWAIIFLLFLANVGLTLWTRSESRYDWLHMDNKIDDIHAEIKDLYGRLISIEERKK